MHASICLCAYVDNHYDVIPILFIPSRNCHIRTYRHCFIFTYYLFSQGNHFCFINHHQWKRWFSCFGDMNVWGYELEGNHFYFQSWARIEPKFSLQTDPGSSTDTIDLLRLTQKHRKHELLICLWFNALMTLLQLNDSAA